MQNIVDFIKQTFSVTEFIPSHEPYIGTEKEFLSYVGEEYAMAT